MKLQDEHAPLAERRVASAHVPDQSDVDEIGLPAPGRIPHPRECLPRRPARVPSWQPRAQNAGRAPLPRALREGWHSPRLVADPRLGQLRINFNYRNHFTTAAGFGEKPGRAQYFEGPYELALFRLLEMSTAVTDYQFQPLALQWLTTAGTVVHYTTDAIYSTADGRIFVEEVKASSAYFDEPATRDLLERFEAQLARTGAEFVRRGGRRLADPVFWRTVKDAFDDRRTAFGDDDVDRALAVVMAEGGSAPLGRVLEALPVPSRQAMAMFNAMMLRRHVAVDLLNPPVADSPVTVPAAPEDPDALRNFLRRFAGAA